jgi:hypothetical protein
VVWFRSDISAPSSGPNLEPEADIRLTTRRYIPEVITPLIQRWENLKSHMPTRVESRRDVFADYRQSFVCFAGRRARILVASAWLLSFCFSIPIAIFYEEKRIQGNAQYAL